MDLGGSYSFKFEFIFLLYSLMIPFICCL